MRNLAVFAALYLLGAAATALAAVAVDEPPRRTPGSLVTIYVGTGQLAAFLFVAVVICIVGALVEWLADNWRHRH